MSLVTYELTDRVAVLTLNRPEARNAQNQELLKELDAGWRRAEVDPEARVIVVRAEGKHFSAGHDMGVTKEELYGPEPGVGPAYRAETDKFFDLTRRWRNIPKPSFAAVQGACIAAGLMLAWPCDLIIASDDAFFSDPTVIMGTNGIEYHAHTWEFGARKAKELLFTAGRLSAHDAERIGMVNRVVPRDELDVQTMELARQIALMHPFAIAQAKRSVNLALDAAGQQVAIQAAFDIHWTTHGHAMSVTGGDAVLAGLEEMKGSNRG
jgi:enoyl-CoA hydratase/carnithine racemase